MIGIGGSGSDRSFRPFARDEVTGSDRAYDPSFQHPVFRTFLDMGVALFPQDGAGAQARRRSSRRAVRRMSPIPVRARPVWHRSVVLA